MNIAFIIIGGILLVLSVTSFCCYFDRYETNKKKFALAGYILGSLSLILSLWLIIATANITEDSCVVTYQQLDTIEIDGMKYNLFKHGDKFRTFSEGYTEGNSKMIRTVNLNGWHSGIYFTGWSDRFSAVDYDQELLDTTR